MLAFASCSHQPAGKRYQLDGRVVAVDATAHELTIAHEDIPGLMKGMTMPFQVNQREYWIFNNIAPGDAIHATLLLSDHAELDDISFTKRSDAGSSGTSNLRIPQPGDEVPDLELINEEGKAIHLRQFRGKPLLLTFIYTRCPFPDFCVRMSHNFAEVLKDLRENPKVFDQAQLLSISIDPENDRPAVLRDYGKRYAGQLDPDFKHWVFASGTLEQVRKAADFFGLAYNQKDNQIVHGLRTVLISPDGRVLKVYSGNDWKPEEVGGAFSAAAGA
jgi:protein SCO1/2